MSNQNGESKQVGGIEFPKRFKCPHCGTDMPIVEGITNEMKQNNRASPETFFASNVKQVVLYDPTKPGLQAPIVSLYSDICGGCGMEYNRMASYSEQMTSELFKDMPPSGPLPPGMRKPNPGFRPGRGPFPPFMGRG